MSVCRITVTMNVEPSPEAVCSISIAYGVNPASANSRRISRRPICVPPIGAEDSPGPRHTGHTLRVVAGESAGAS